MYLYQALPRTQRLLQNLQRLSSSELMPIGKLGFITFDRRTQLRITSDFGDSWYVKRLPSKSGGCNVYGLTLGSTANNLLVRLVQQCPQLHRYVLCHLVGQARKDNAINTINKQINENSLPLASASWEVSLNFNNLQAELKPKLKVINNEGNEECQEFDPEQVDLTPYLSEEGLQTLPLLHV